MAANVKPVCQKSTVFTGLKSIEGRICRLCFCLLRLLPARHFRQAYSNIRGHCKCFYGVPQQISTRYGKKKASRNECGMFAPLAPHRRRFYLYTLAVKMGFGV
jgi:hypothetical protein